MIIPSFRVVMTASTLWLAAAAAFTLWLLVGAPQTPMLGLVRGLIFFGLVLSLAALGAAWFAWFAHVRTSGSEQSASARSDARADEPVRPALEQGV